MALSLYFFPSLYCVTLNPVDPKTHRSLLVLFCAFRWCEDESNLMGATVEELECSEGGLSMTAAMLGVF